MSFFVGRQLSRLKLALSYLTLAMSMITAAMTIKLNYNIEIEWILLSLPLVILGAILFGYFLDKYNINTHDQRKSNEMVNRFLLTSDIKNQEFYLLQTKMILTAIKKMQEKQDFDVDDLLKYYDDYRERWTAHETKE